MLATYGKLLGCSRSDDDGNENICLDPLNLLNEGNFFSWS